MKNESQEILHFVPYVQELSLVREEYATVGSIVVRYRLWMYRASLVRYAVEVSTEAETRFAYLGSDFADAARLFTLLCEGTVTPCTVSDILEDVQGA